ncbi:hypothetical protein [Zunongwangia sp. H14]|uniref:hypothetical protein n=1 Tax=Zunongwangia sp. H14 TaxID=3240792 RepID=UPI003567A4E9
MSFTILTKDFNGIIKLQGVEGESTIYSNSSKFYIEGKISLCLSLNGNEYLSNPLIIPLDKISILKEGSLYFIDLVLDFWIFDFSNILILFRNEISPILYIKQIGISKSNSLEISIEKLAMSIIGKIQNVDINNSYIYFDTNNPPLRLTKLKSPRTGRFGFYLENNSYGICIVAGSPSTSITLDDFESVSVNLSSDTIINFELGQLNLKFLSTMASDHFVQFNDNSEWELDKNIGVGFSFLEIDSIVCSDGWLTTQKFKDVETTISKTHPLVNHLELRTKLYTNTKRLTFHYPLVINNIALNDDNILELNDKKFIDVPHFVYESNLEETPTLTNLHYGIKVRGLNNEKGSSVKLDANLAVLRLDTNSKKLFLQAGDSVTVKGEKQNSIVLPKINTQESNKRLVKIPCIPSSLVVNGSTTKSSFVINTKDEKFIINSPELETSPFAPGNLKTQLNLNFDKLNWIYKENKVEFKIGKDGVNPNEDWLEKFSINPTTSSFQILDSQNLDVLYDKPAPNFKFKNTEVTSTIITTTTVNEAEKEKLIYIAYAGAIGFSAAYLAGGLICETANPKEIYTCLQKKGKEYVNINFKKEDLNDPRVKEWLLNQNVNELTIVYYNYNERIKKFIDDNINIDEPTEAKPTSIGFWPIISFIGIPLVIKKKGESAKYCFDIVNNNFPNSNIIVGIGLDQNKAGRIDLSKNFGFNPVSFKKITTKYPLLFPTYNGNQATNGKIDPTSEKFVGVIFRNMPLMVQVPSNKISTVLKKLLDEINRNLFLEFGWRDEKGVTWISRIPESITSNPNYTGFNIVDNSIVKFNISKIECIGQESKLSKFSFDVFLGLIKTAADNHKFSIKANAHITFNDKGIDNFIITPITESRNLIRVSDTIPGFDYIRFNKFETNFKQLFASIELFPDEKLINVLPIFEQYKKIDGELNLTHVLKTIASFDLETGAAVISIFLDTSKNIKVFGKWPMAIKVVNIFINSSNKNTLEIVGEFNLGMENFLKVGGKIVLSHEASGSWDFDIQLDRVGGSLALSDELKIEGLFKWGGTYPSKYYENPQSLPREPLKKESLNEGSGRPFMGILNLTAPSMFGDFQIYAKIGSKNGIPFSLFGLRWDKEINLGFGKLHEPEFLVSKNSDRLKSIENIVINGAFKGIEALKGPVDFEQKIQWLEEFDYSDKTGLTLIASGKLAYGSVTEKPKGITGILYSSKGLLRIEGWFKIPGIKDEVQIVFSIDFVRKRLLVGFQLPTFYFPTEVNPSLVFQPGQVFFGTNFGGSPYFLWSLGWPPQTGGSAYERDWSKANQATWYPPTFPMPNMVAAGVMYELDFDKGYLLFAAALKAGWKYEINFGIGKAGLEVSLGGVLVIKIMTKESRFETLKLKNRYANKIYSTYNYELQTYHSHLTIETEYFETIFENYSMIKRDLNMAFDLNAILGEVFADLKGYAEVSIFGITLAGVYLSAYARMRVCGSTKNGITHIGGSFGTRFCVKIGCVTKCKSIDITVTVISGHCEAAPLNYQFLPQF